MSGPGLDPRAQLAAFAAAVLAALGGGLVGLAVVAAGATAWTLRLGSTGRSLRVVAAVVPLALAVVVLDALAGRGAEGAIAAARLVTVTALASAFARTVDARAMSDGLRALRVPYPVVFVLVAGARFVPLAAADLADLADAARLRGITNTGGAFRRIRDWGLLLVPLLVLTIRRGLQLGESMEARGFSGGAPRATRVELGWRARDTVVVLIAAAGLAALAALGARGW